MLFTPAGLSARAFPSNPASMRYEGRLYRPPSEHDAYIVQATIGCSHNKCVYCAMYRDKEYRVRALEETLADIAEARRGAGARVEKFFVADGDALAMDVDTWMPILAAAQEVFPRLRRTSCYATAENILEKTAEELSTLREAGLELLYLGPESGDDVTLKRIVKGSTADEHVEAARRAHAAGFRISVIAMLGVGGVERSEEHARGTGELVTRMDPAFFSALTTTVVPDTPLARWQDKGGFELPSVEAMLGELRTMVEETRPTAALFRTNHASNYLPLGGRLPQDREEIVAAIDSALEGKVRLRPEFLRGL